MILVAIVDVCWNFAQAAESKVVHTITYFLAHRTSQAGFFQFADLRVGCAVLLFPGCSYLVRIQSGEGS